MTDSISLLSAQITFLESKLVLIHIPISQYAFFVQPILRLLFGEDQDDDCENIPWTNRHDFLNVSITPIECSIICSKQFALRYIIPVIDQLNALIGSNRPAKDTVQISTEEYIVIQVDGQGLDAGQRVLELTGPLAMAGISIFFITTYFSDYILVPARTRRIVTTALEQRGFVFSKQADAFVSQLSPILYQGSSPFERSQTNHSPSSDSRPSSAVSAPTTPPAKDIPELQIRTFTKLKNKGIKPIGYPNLRLISCAGSAEYDQASVEKLRNDLLQVLLATTCKELTSSSATGLPEPKSKSKPVSSSNSFLTGLGFSLSLPGTDAISGSQSPQTDNESTAPNFSTTFLSITLTSTDPISVLLEQRLLPRLGGSLLGNKRDDDVLVPIILDLTDLGWEATGIIGGVAGRLSLGEGRLDSGKLQLPTDDETVSHGEETSEVEDDFGNDEDSGGPIEVSFLSTARAGTVIVKACHLKRALRALEVGMREANDD